MEGRRGPPWDEKWWCNNCDHDFLTEPSSTSCTWCGQGEVRLLWNEQKAERETLTAMQQHSAQVTVAVVMTDGRPESVGIIELRPLSLDQLSEHVGVSVASAVLGRFGPCGAHFFVQHLIVSPRWRSQDIGAKLLDQAISRAQSDPRSGIPLVSLAQRARVATDWFKRNQLTVVQLLDDKRLLVGNIVRSV